MKIIKPIILIKINLKLKFSLIVLKYFIKYIATIGPDSSLFPIMDDKYM